MDWYEILEYPDLLLKQNSALPVYSIGSKIHIYKHKQEFPVEQYDLAILGICEDRNAIVNKGSCEAPDPVRKQFYKLSHRFENLKIIDLGNIHAGHTPNDTYVAASHIIASLISNNTIPIIIGGSNDLVFANYMAYEHLQRIINYVSIDQQIDISDPGSNLHSMSYINYIMTRQPNYLFLFTNIGYQSYFIDEQLMQLMNKLLFDAYRIGFIQHNLNEAEAILRNSDMVSIDVNAIRHADAPAHELASPNGFYGDTICQICRYAGASDKITSFGIYEYNPHLDIHDITAKLIAQMIWYFIDGILNRRQDNPRENPSDFVKYHVYMDKINQEIIFYKSKKTDRWWMEVPFPSTIDEKFKRHYIIACTYNDYLTALKNELPDRWWQTYQKIM